MKNMYFSGPILTKSNMDPNPPAQPESVGPKDVDVTRLAVLSEHHTRYDQNIEEVCSLYCLLLHFYHIHQ